MKKDVIMIASLALMTVVLAGILPAIVWIISLWTDSNLEFWLSYFKGEAINVPMWLSVLITIILNGVIVVANIVSELLQLVV